MDKQGFAARALNNLGIVTSSRGDYEQGVDLQQQALTIRRQLGDQRGIASSLHSIGHTSQKQGQPTPHWFRQSLAIAQEIRAIPIILFNLVGFAAYLIRHTQAERAASLVGLVQHHPAQDSDTREGLDEVMPQLEAALPADELAAALERGKSLDLDTVVQELLDEFGTDEDASSEDE